MDAISVSESVLYFILSFGILQGILLTAVTLFYPGGDRSVNLFLAFYILSISMIMMLPIAIATIPWQQSFFHQPVPLLVGPFLYLYICSFRKIITWKVALPHFLIFILFFIPAYWNMAVLSDKYPGMPGVPAEALRNPLSIALTCTKIIHPIIYYFLSLGALGKYERTVKQLFSEIGKMRITWARILINGFLLLITVAIVMYALILQKPEQFRFLFLINMVIGCPYIYLVTFKGITQPTLWQLQKQSKQEVADGLNEIEKLEDQRVHGGSRKPVLDDSKLSEMISRIQKLMEGEKLYLKPDLTVQDIAEQLGTPAYQVSQIINECMNKNFYDLINGYRVDEARRLLLDPKSSNYKILTIGTEAGFNSKTTFNTVFKKSTGMTPTEYREKHNVAATRPG
jgi:AraC-like DNA-binding protein